MTHKVLVVDDSTFYRRRVAQILNEDASLEVIDVAKDGQEAIDKAARLKPDVITMDVEMPVMDGITAVQKIMASTPTPVLMFSSLTHEGAQATLDALDAGALDFLPKKFEDIAKDRAQAVALLRDKVKAIASRRVAFKRQQPITPAAKSPGSTKSTQKFIRSTSQLDATKESQAKVDSRPIQRSSGKSYKVLAIGTSTGGPVALQKVLTKLPVTFNYPCLVVQHMPGTFTKAFADRLDRLCGVRVKEAEDGESVKSGVVYLAPGGKQMVLQGDRHTPRIVVTDADAADKLAYKPSVDLTFSSISRVYGGDVLGVILTGMGADGKEGCRTLKSKGAKIWAQDEQSSVVYGMPQAVTVANIAEASLDLESIGSSILSEMHSG